MESKKYLNYFFPYSSITETHENHLTRAFLVLLRYSNTALQYFYDYIYHENEGNELLPLYKVPLNEVYFETQKGTLPEAYRYLSVLITNEKYSITTPIQRCNRNAIYDGIITIGDELVIFIENKPLNKNVWEPQLCPDQNDVSQDAILIERPVILEWKEIINFLHNIIENTMTLPSEKLLIEDFFQLINESYGKLNPYNNLSKCNTCFLASKRILQILNEIVVDSEKVKFHHGWGHYIDLGFAEIKKIGLILNNDRNDNWDGLTISADFASTMSQARAFYDRLDTIASIKERGFHIEPNFHLAFQFRNLVFLNSPESALDTYFDYWKEKGRHKLIATPKNELETILQELDNEKIIIYDDLKKSEYDLQILKKGYQTVNICPAIQVSYYIAKDEAVEMDKNGTLISFINHKMKGVLNILNYPLEEVIRSVK